MDVRKRSMLFDGRTKPAKLSRPGTSVLFLLYCCAAAFLLLGCAAADTGDTGLRDIALLKKWHGDYPVSHLNRLPEGQQNKAVGYIEDTQTLLPVWRIFMPHEILPAVDFSKNIVIFKRNRRFYNRTSILRVVLRDGTAEIITMETMSTTPIKDRVAMAMAVIPRAGVLAIRDDTDEITLPPAE